MKMAPSSLRESFAIAMRKRGLATGHGDTLADLHKELWWQVDEMKALNKRMLSPGLKAAIERVVEALWCYEQSVPQTIEWLGDSNKCEVRLGALRELRREAGL